MKINNFIKCCFFVLIAFVFCFLINSIQNKIIRHSQFQGDFFSFYEASKSASTNKNIYNYKIFDSLLVSDDNKIKPVSNKYFVHAVPYLYSPFLAYLIIPLSKLSFIDAEFIWKYLNILLFSLSLLLSFFIVKKYIKQNDINYSNKFKKILILFLLSLTIILSFRVNIFGGQINIIVSFFISLSLLLYLNKNDILSGVSLSVAILIKSSPFLLLLYFISVKKYKIVYGSILGGIIFVLYTLIFGAYNNWINFIKFLPNVSFGKQIDGLQPLDNGVNKSISALIAVIFGVNTFLSHILPLFILIGFLIFLSFETIKYRNNKNIYLMIILYIIILIISSPIFGNHHSIFILSCVPLLFSFIYFNKENSKRFWQKIILILLIFLSCTDLHLYLFPTLNGIKRLFIIDFLNLYSLICLFIYIYLLIRKSFKN